MHVILYSFKLSLSFGKSVKNTIICKIYSALNKCLVILAEEKINTINNAFNSFQQITDCF